MGHFVTQFSNGAKIYVVNSETISKILTSNYLS